MDDMRIDGNCPYCGEGAPIVRYVVRTQIHVGECICGAMVIVRECMFTWFAAEDRVPVPKPETWRDRPPLL